MAHTITDQDEIISGINVTPLVDVILVILIIFIMTASIIFKNEIPIDLPRAQSSEQAVSGLLNVGIDRQGQIYINGRRGQISDLPRIVSELRRGAGSGAAPKAFVSADVAAQYGIFASVVDRLRLEGIVDIALDTQPGTVEEGR
jgi:biopolymer transport protein TolR